MNSKSFLEEYLEAAGMHAYVSPMPASDFVTEISARIPFLPQVLLDSSSMLGNILPMRCDGYNVWFSLPEIWRRLEACGDNAPALEMSRFSTTLQDVRITVIKPGLVEIHYAMILVMVLARDPADVTQNYPTMTGTLDPTNDRNVARAIADSLRESSLKVADADNHRLKFILGMYDPTDAQCFRVPISGHTSNLLLQNEVRWNSWLINNLSYLLGVKTDVRPQDKEGL